MWTMIEDNVSGQFDFNAGQDKKNTITKLKSIKRIIKIT